MEITTMCFQPMEEDCYIIDTGAGAVLVDPGDKPWRIVDFLTGHDLVPVCILLTHGHFDHIGAVAALAERYSPEICIHEQDAAMLTDPAESLAARFGVPQTPVSPTRLLHGGDTVEIGGLSLTVLETPGHTRGSVCYAGNGVLFTGDTLFKDNVGRTDFPGGSKYALSQSLLALGRLEGAYRVLPGHGAETTLDREKRRNPYMR